MKTNERHHNAQGRTTYQNSEKRWFRRNKYKMKTNEHHIELTLSLKTQPTKSPEKNVRSTISAVFG